jgi:hypothetical protein
MIARAKLLDKEIKVKIATEKTKNLQMTQGKLNGRHKIKMIEQKN